MQCIGECHFQIGTVLREALPHRMARLSKSEKANVAEIEAGSEQSAVLNSSRLRYSTSKEDSYLITDMF